ncbi:hypothetical protein N855_gp63 [Mycobacterium phage Muddy]|uniref:Uncharacterized protein n=2 Tax=Mycobacterium phage Muddy TaxID=1340829 RepID=A0ACD4QAC6_9CAUD|nr:hypothetical protein N855_gp63 [Mycobacterium phage Muddy]WEV84107.1 hypothetical protein PBI_MUDDY_63 [Mycobacterium phage Muddy]
MEAASLQSLLGWLEAQGRSSRPNPQRSVLLLWPSDPLGGSPVYSPSEPGHRALPLSRKDQEMIRIPTYHKRQVRRTLGVMAAGAVLAGTGLAFSDHANASPGISKSELICNMMDAGEMSYLEIGIDIVGRYNVTPEDAGAAMYTAVTTTCPEHKQDLQDWADQF